MTTKEGKWWVSPETRREAIEDAAYYMWYGNPSQAIAIIVALCASCDKKGDERYDEEQEKAYVTYYQRKG